MRDGVEDSKFIPKEESRSGNTFRMCIKGFSMHFKKKPSCCPEEWGGISFREKII